MKVEIRRNQDGQLSFDFNEESRDELMGLLSPATDPDEEVERLLDESARKRRDIETELWLYFEAHPTMDQLGNRITKETHEIGYDVDFEDWGNGLMMAVAKNIYVRPTKSEL